MATSSTPSSTRPGARTCAWTTPVRLFSRGGFHLYDTDAAIVATEIATATMTAAAGIEIYAEMFTALEASASFGDTAIERLAGIGTDYRQLA